MKPTKRKLVVWAGTTFTQQFQFGTGTTDEDGNTVIDTPTNMNGWTARMQVRTSIDSEDVVLELTTENGRISIDGDNGIVNLLIDAETTAGLTAQSYTYDLELIKDDEVTVYKPFYGGFTVKAEVTR